ncbi:MAG: DUF3656 domain-containing protein [Eubacteriales bacterium]|nr:DUF3656 domain-containing protein [Eubacteriales bacterium]
MLKIRKLGKTLNNHQKIELLAPAGSYESFEAAIGAGADAVYVGGASFGARAYAQNFGQEELIRAIRTAHIHGKKLYLTVNTLLKNRELKEQLYDYLAPYYEAGLDAVIVQDLGVFRFIKRNFPGLHLHASTQMTVTGPMGMKFLEEQGASRVVAARELSLAELRAMHKASPIEIEAFIHGALCYSYSGQCLMSSLLGGRSGNRGRCAQPCRLSYGTSQDGKRFQGNGELCPLSLKDICTIDLLPEILEAGVMSLKIEGRMKQPRYTAGVTGIYRKYLDLFLKKGQDGYQVEEKDRKFLLEIFNRGGSCSGYFLQHNGPSMMAFSNEKKTGEISPEIIKRKEKINGNLILFPGSPAILEVKCGDICVTASAGEVQSALNQPMEEKRIRQQMEKLGNTEFQWNHLEIQMDGNIFIPVKVLNEVRRDALLQLENALTVPSQRKLSKLQDTVRVSSGTRGNTAVSRKNHAGPRVFVSCETIEQAEVLSANREISGIYLPYDAMEKCMEKGMAEQLELYLALPHMVRGTAPEGYFAKAAEWVKRGMAGFLVRNLESYALVKELGYAEKCVLDSSLYTWNDEAAAFWRKEGISRNTIPLELNEKELLHRENCESEMLIYGYLPLMISSQCVKKNLYCCDGQEGRVFLKDRYDKVFPAVCCCYPWKIKNTGNPEYCYNMIYNSIPFGLLREKDRVAALGVQSVRLAFTIEKPWEAAEILKEFLDVYLHGREPSEREFTKGHFKRGAE